MNIYENRISQLRAEMKKYELDCYMVVTDDFHASEYVGDYAREREWLCGFSGTNGTLLVLEDFAGLWTDGRYFIQAAEQLKGTGVELMKMGEPGVPTIPEFLAESAKSKPCFRLGYDGRTVSYGAGKTIRDRLAEEEIPSEFVIDLDLPGELWEDRPEFPHGPVWLLDEKYAGRSREDKLKELREKVSEAGADGILISSLDDIAWLYNYRGSDIAYTPVAMAYTIVTDDRAVLYIGADGIAEGPAVTLADETGSRVLTEAGFSGVEIKPYPAAYEDVRDFRGRLMMDKNSVNEAMAYSAEDVLFGISPTQMMKAVKNETECENIKKAHVKDGVALTRTLFHLKKGAESGEIYKETECTIADYLTEERRKQENFVDLSFESIIAAEEHAAICHYEPDAESDRRISEGFLLMDTGGHYLEGTTDVTRTVSLGRISHEMKELYTAVLKGHLDVRTAVFPEGTCGYEMDSLARKYVLELGYDYNHGTGHGVGYLLNVHEGPNSIRKTAPKDGTDNAFRPGMVTSNEPGVYLEGRFGIRIENLILCERAEKPGYLKMTDLTMVSYDRDAILLSELSPIQLEALKEYSCRVYETVSPYLNEEEKIWLKKETEF